MIKTNKNHKKVDTSELKRFSKKLIPIFLSGILIGYGSVEFLTNNVDTFKTSYTITNESVEADFEYLDDFSFLDNYPNIHNLTIRNTVIKDLSKIKELKRLKSLTLENCIITDNFLESNTLDTLIIINTQFNLEIKATKLKEIFSSNDNLTYGHIQKIESSNLEIISLIHTNIIDTNFLYQNPLKKLYLEKIDITDIDFDNISLSLEELQLNNIETESKINLNPNNKIKEFRFSSNNIHDYSFIQNLNNAETIVINYSNFEDISYLKNNKKLKILYLIGSKIENLDDLPEQIVQLGIAHTDNLKNIDRLYELKKLKYLSLTGNEFLVDNKMYEYLNKKRINHGITKEEIEVINNYKKVIKYIITDNMNDFEKVNAIINFLVSQLDYKTELIGDENVLTNGLSGRGVCQAYADMAVLLGRLANVEIHTAYDMNISHVWNECKLYDNYYSFDATWINKQKKSSTGENKTLYGLTPIYDFPGHSLTASSIYYNDIIQNKGQSSKWINNQIFDNINPEDYVTKKSFYKIINKIFDTSYETNDDNYITDEEAINIISENLNMKFQTIYQKKAIKYENLATMLNNTIVNVIDKEGTYYLNGLNILVKESNVHLEGNVQTLFILGDIDIDIYNLKYKNIIYINKEKNKQI